MTRGKSLFSAKCLVKSSRFSSFKKATSSAGLVGAAQPCLVCPVLAPHSSVPVSQPCSCRVCLSSCPHDGTASFWLSPWLTQTRASGLLTPMTQLPEFMIERLLGPVLTLLLFTVHRIPSRPFSSLSRHHLCSALPTAHKCFQDKWWSSSRIVHLDPPGLCSFSYRDALQRNGGIKDDV